LGHPLETREGKGERRVDFWMQHPIRQRRPHVIDAPRGLQTPGRESPQVVEQDENPPSLARCAGAPITAFHRHRFRGMGVVIMERISPPRIGRQQAERKLKQMGKQVRWLCPALPEDLCCAGGETT